MVNVLVRNLPDEAHELLRQRAAREGKSLQQFLIAELQRLARRTSVQEVLERAQQQSGGRIGLAEAAEYLAEERRQR
ncbi:MAG: hypothetical protein OXF00_07920 [bacterium]|nr:hypothetical protein [bacterium]